MLGIRHEVVRARVDESVLTGEKPEAHVERLARAKASAVARLNRGRWVLAGDTVVVLGGAILGKPGSPTDAVDMLERLNGKRHTVLTALALAEESGDLRSRVDAAHVTCRTFKRAAAEAYVATGEPLDKAGAYGIQGRGAALVQRLEGDYYTVVGLSVAGLIDLLAASGLVYDFRGLASSGLSS